MKIDPPSPSLRRGKQFFAKLKRRNVYKVAVAQLRRAEHLGGRVDRLKQHGVGF